METQKILSMLDEKSDRTTRIVAQNLSGEESASLLAKIDQDKVKHSKMTPVVKIIKLRRSNSTIGYGLSFTIFITNSIYANSN